MKIGFLTACLPSVVLDDLVKWASESGFQALELAAWPAGFSQIDASRVKNLFDQNGLEISAMAYYDNNLHPDLETRDAFLNHLVCVIDMASLLEVEFVGTFAGARPDRSPTENIKEIGVVFRYIVGYAENKGVKIMIENCPMENWVKFGFPGNYAYSPELWDALFNEVDSDSFGLNLDPSHLYWLGIDLVHAVKEFAPKIFHVHAKDTEILPDGKNRYGVYGKQINPEPWKSGWWRYRLPGLGEIDWKQFIHTLQESGYDDVISIEHEDPEWEGSEEKVKEGLLIGRKHLSQCIEER